MKISGSTARRLVLYCQGLDGQWQLPEDKEGVAQTVERLGYVQLDTISVIQRAHHHTLWVRRPDYEPRMLHDLLAHDRRVFEGWTHAASYIPMRDYGYYLPRMRARRSNARQWLEQHEQLVEGVCTAPVKLPMRLAAAEALGAIAEPSPVEFLRELIDQYAHSVVARPLTEPVIIILIVPPESRRKPAPKLPKPWHKRLAS